MLQDNKAAVQFVEGMINEKGFSNLDAEVREQLRDDLLVRLERQINQAILNSLSDEQLTLFEVILEKNEVDKVSEFLYKEGINVDAIVAQAMAEFRGNYLASSNNV